MKTLLERCQHLTRKIDAAPRFPLVTPLVQEAASLVYELAARSQAHRDELEAMRARLERLERGAMRALAEQIEQGAKHGA